MGARFRKEHPCLEDWSELPACPVHLSIVPWSEFLPEWRDRSYRESDRSLKCITRAELSRQFERMHEPEQLREEQEWRAKFLAEKLAKP
jgi:hypothetical protein